MPAAIPHTTTELQQTLVGSAYTLAQLPLWGRAGTYLMGSLVPDLLAIGDLVKSGQAEPYTSKANYNNASIKFNNEALAAAGNKTPYAEQDSVRSRGIQALAEVREHIEFLTLLRDSPMQSFLPQGRESLELLIGLLYQSQLAMLSSPYGGELLLACMDRNKKIETGEVQLQPFDKALGKEGITSTERPIIDISAFETFLRRTPKDLPPQ